MPACVQSFCGIFSLESGIILMSAIFMSLTYVSLVVNVSDCTDENGQIRTGIFTFIVVYLLAVGSLVTIIAAVYKDTQTLLSVALGGFVLLTLIWTVASCLSFFGPPSVVDNICINNRCSESFWLASLKFRELLETEPIVTKQMKEDVETELTTELTSEAIETRETRIISITVETTELLTEETTESLTEETTESQTEPSTEWSTANATVSEFELVLISEYYKNNFGGPMIVAICIFVIILFLLIFMIILIWNYKQELKWLEKIEKLSP